MNQRISKAETQVTNRRLAREIIEYRLDIDATEENVERLANCIRVLGNAA